MKRRGDPLRAAGTLAAIAGALLFAPASASAYCRTAACPTKDIAWQVCAPEQPSDCGTPLYWANRCVGFTLQKDASVQVSLKDAEAVFQEAFETWMAADCGGGKTPSISVEYQGTVECDAQEYNKNKGNANIIMFRDDSWPYGNQTTVLALTTVTYNLETSEIYDADMELNSASISGFTLSDVGSKYDLLSIATHEAGHFLGLAHSLNTDATMFTDYKVGTTFLRDLTADDVNGICAAYPPIAPRSVTCDPEPRHGFASRCGDDQEALPEPSGGCSISGAGATSGDASRGPLPAGTTSGVLAALAGLALATLRRRRRLETARGAGSMACRVNDQDDDQGRDEPRAGHA